MLSENTIKPQLKTKIIHLGFGAFHRAHQALILDELIKQGQTDWGYCEINLFGGEQLILDLKKQGLQYHVLEKGMDTDNIKKINSICEALHSEIDGYNAILEKMAEPQIAIVSLTITEKGYCVDQSTGKLDLNNPLIQKDLTQDRPFSALAYIIYALKLRKERSLAPFTVMSCDNIMENGEVTKNATLELAYQLDRETAIWIEENVTFPCTMVDRIVPAATKETLTEIERKLGYPDPCAIACEEFRQWVIEDNFVKGRPDWQKVKVELVADVRPFEQMKLRMLNGSHSFLAYLGYLAGYKHISDTMQDDIYRKATKILMLEQQAPTLNVPESTNLITYADLLIARFTNPKLKHQTAQIAMDGSQKLPPRILESIQFHLTKGNNFELLALTVAGWARYVSGIDEQGNKFEIHDPMKTQFEHIHQTHTTATAQLDALLSLSAIFPTELANNRVFKDAVHRAYQHLLQKGARETVKFYLDNYFSK